MSELHDAALRAGVFSYLQKRAGELLNAAKDDLKTALPQGDVVAGRSGDAIVAKASWVKGRQTIIQDDPRELLEWVKTNHPTEIVESVNPAFIGTFKAVGGVVIDGQGEPVPGMSVRQGDAYISVKGNDETPFLVASLLKQGAIGFDGQGELP